MWTDAEKKRYAEEFIAWLMVSIDELDLEDWWSEDHDGEYFKEQSLTEVVKLLRESKIIIKVGR